MASRPAALSSAEPAAPGPGTPGRADGLQEWLRAVGFNESRIGPLLKVFDEEAVDTVADLRLLANMHGGPLDTRLAVLIAAKIRSALAQEDATSAAAEDTPPRPAPPKPPPPFRLPPAVPDAPVTRTVRRSIDFDALAAPAAQPADAAVLLQAALRGLLARRAARRCAHMAQATARLQARLEVMRVQRVRLQAAARGLLARAARRRASRAVCLLQAAERVRSARAERRRRAARRRKRRFVAKLHAAAEQREVARANPEAAAMAAAVAWEERSRAATAAAEAAGGGASLCMNCLEGVMGPAAMFCDPCYELGTADRADDGMRREERFAAARDMVALLRAEAARLQALAAAERAEEQGRYARGADGAELESERGEQCTGYVQVPRP